MWISGSLDDQHTAQIKKALGIASIQTTASSCISRDKDLGAQIDLLIDRRDRVINLCAMKFSIYPFIITKGYAEELAEKIRVFKGQTKTNKAIYLTLITTFGLASNTYASSMFQSNLDMDIFFE